MVVITPYSPEWPNHFRIVRAELLAAFAPISVPVEHIGSTSVPGLAAKPVIDVLLGADSLALIEERIEALERLGYGYVSKYERDLPLRRYFVKPEGALPRVHVHGVVLGSRLWREHIGFRDALRLDDALRAEYQVLKLDLAARFSHDKAAYTEAKAPFVQSILATACPPPNAERPGD